MKVSTAARNAMITALTDLLNVGGAGKIEIRTGAAPTNPSDPDSGTLLATNNLTNPCVASVSGGVATFDTISDDSNVDANGTAEHFRAKNNAGTVVFQGSVGTSGADLNFNSVAFAAGGICHISSFTATQPA